MIYFPLNKNNFLNFQKHKLVFHHNCFRWHTYHKLCVRRFVTWIPFYGILKIIRHSNFPNKVFPGFGNRGFFHYLRRKVGVFVLDQRLLWYWGVEGPVVSVFRPKERENRFPRVLCSYVMLLAKDLICLTYTHTYACRV